MASPVSSGSRCWKPRPYAAGVNFEYTAKRSPPGIAGTQGVDCARVRAPDADATVAPVYSATASAATRNSLACFMLSPLSRAPPLTGRNLGAAYFGRSGASIYGLGPTSFVPRRIRWYA